jgi:3-oxoacyl-[acyl-carrier protein] reductase
MLAFWVELLEILRSQRWDLWMLRRLAADGASVAFTYSSSEEKALQLVREIASGGGKALALRANSASAKELQAAVAKTTEVFGPLDVFAKRPAF